MTGKIIIVVMFMCWWLIQRKIIKDLFSPANLYFYWTMFLVIPALFWYPNHEWKIWGIAWWLLSCVIYTTGAVFGKKIEIRRKGIFRFKTGIRGFIPIFFCCFFCAGILYSLLLLRNNGFSVTDLGNAESYYAINNYMQGHRYGHLDLNESVIQQVCLSCTYALPLCAGYWFPKVKKIVYKFVSLLAFVPNVVIMLINNTKTGVIFAVMLFVVGFLIGYVEHHRAFPVITKRIIFLLTILGTLFLILMFLAIYIRYRHSPERSTVTYIFETLRDYIWGGVVNFDRNFMLFGEDLSKFQFIPGSNILSANYFWILKYGYLGVLVLWFLRGMMAGYLFKKLKNGTSDIIDKVLLVYTYITAWYFFIYMPFSYMTIIFGVFVWYPVYLLLDRRKHVYRTKLYKNQGGKAK